MKCATVARTVLFVVAAAFVSSDLSLVTHAESFDSPLRRIVKDYGPTPYMDKSSGARIKLSCFYYSAFMIKQLDDEGQKGSQWVKVVPVSPKEMPPCRRTHILGEKFVSRDGWYFIGVKDQLLVMEASDGDSGGMTIRMLDWRNEKEVFRDLVLLAAGKIDLDFERNPKNEISLRYLRVIEGDCSIPKDGATCWDSLRKKYNLPFAKVPTCTGYKEGKEKPWVVGDPGIPPEDITTPSVVIYPATADLLPTPTIKAIPGSVMCTPVD